MSKIEKLILRLQSRPTDLTWNETKRILNHFGYEEIQGSGSRVKFFNEEIDDVIHMHKPHPRNILRRYQIDMLLEKLTQYGLIDDDE